eukprot:scaffold1673_cov330-Pavlova_lutheri.AAC.9
MARNWTVSASAFFLSNACPLDAPTSLPWMTASTVTVGTTGNLPCCDAMTVAGVVQCGLHCVWLSRGVDPIWIGEGTVGEPVLHHGLSLCAIRWNRSNHPRSEKILPCPIEGGLQTRKGSESVHPSQKSIGSMECMGHGSTAPTLMDVP